ncbi:hypothetical protein CLOP_g1238 [Closterium sp. NIES-67]|nr:hypothetical protein CLOP_g1238 [Closterium sp. NIES-67]
MLGRRRKQQQQQPKQQRVHESGAAEREAEVERTIVVDHGDYSSSCGYCRGARGSSHSHGITAETMTVQDYQDLLDRGWRRSGCFLYKPDMPRTCCPAYTIRLVARRFQPNKEQRKVLKRMERFLSGEIDLPAPRDRSANLPDPSSNPGSGLGLGLALGLGSGSGASVQPRAEPVNGQSRGQKDGLRAASSEGRLQPATAGPLAAVHAQVEGALKRVLAQWWENGAVPSGMLLPAVTLRPVPANVRSRLGEGKGGEGVKGGEGGKGGEGVKGGKEAKEHRVIEGRRTGNTDVESSGRGGGGDVGGARGARGGEQRGASVAPLPVLTSNVAFLLFSAYKKLQQQQKKPQNQGEMTPQLSDGRHPEHAVLLSSSAQDIAVALVQEVEAGLQSGELPEGVSVRAVNGHVNVLAPAALLRGEESTGRRIATGNAGLPGGGSRGVQQQHHQQHQQDQQQQQPQQQQQQQRTPRVLEITTHRSAFTQEEFDLYRKYQIKVHGDAPSTVTRRAYENFLVNTPLIHVPPPAPPPVAPPPAAPSPVAPPPEAQAPLPSCGYGSFHQQYRIDGRLVAVGVVDVLPRCLSSKYLFWDPDFAFLSLGKFSALKEIEWVQREQQRRPELLLDSYYMGYYIHSCPKMTYKAAYAPSDLLCPLRYLWVPFSLARPLLDHSPYAVLSSALPKHPQHPQHPHAPENLFPTVAASLHQPPSSNAHAASSEGVEGRSAGGPGEDGARDVVGGYRGAGVGETEAEIEVQRELQAAAERGEIGGVEEMDEASSRGPTNEYGVQGRVGRALEGRGGRQGMEEGMEVEKGRGGERWGEELSAGEREERGREVASVVLAMPLLINGSMMISFAQLLETGWLSSASTRSITAALKTFCEAAGPQVARRALYTVR